MMNGPLPPPPVIEVDGPLPPPVIEADGPLRLKRALI
jgi:hypothetical protein